jgi:hypothetical protein
LPIKVLHSITKTLIFIKANEYKGRAYECGDGSYRYVTPKEQVKANLSGKQTLVGRDSGESLQRCKPPTKQIPICYWYATFW